MGTQIIDPMIHGRPSVALIVSPHLDDAVLSCGLAIQTLKAAGWTVYAATVFSHAPIGPVSPIAVRFNTTGYGDAASGVRARRSEDRAALARLGAEVLHLGFFDASFRKRPDGKWLCERYEDIHCLDSHSEPALRTRVRRAIRHAVASTSASLVMGPSGIGGHVDHELVSAAIADIAFGTGRKIIFRWFEDLPYAFDHTSGHTLAPFCRVDEPEMNAKLEALARYASQLTFFGGQSGSGRWQSRFRHHATHHGLHGFVERMTKSPFCWQ